MKYLGLVVIILVANSCFGQQKINLVLKKQLDSVMVLDQKYRDILTYLTDPAKKDSIAKSLSLTVEEANEHYWNLQNNIDSLNVIFIEKVFNRYGYPGKTLVGEPANETAWYVIQHSQKIETYIPLMKKAAETKELPFRLYAMMLDRELVNSGKEQIYGSQVTCRQLKGKGENCFVWPIKDPDEVNKRRKEAGFDLTVEQNAKRLDVDYTVVKLSEIVGVK